MYIEIDKIGQLKLRRGKKAGHIPHGEQVGGHFCESQTIKHSVNPVAPIAQMTSKASRKHAWREGRKGQKEWRG